MVILAVLGIVLYLMARDAKRYKSRIQGRLHMTHPADCGVTFAHDPHLYTTPRGKIKACDGSIEKRS